MIKLLRWAALKYWHLLADAIVSDLYTKEEREILKIQSKRLEMATRLQMERIENMRKRANESNTVATISSIVYPTQGRFCVRFKTVETQAGNSY